MGKTPESLIYSIPIGEGEQQREVEVRVRRLDPVGEGSSGRLDVHIPEMNQRFFADKKQLSELSQVLRTVIDGEGE